MAEKKETAKLEREYVIPLRARYQHVPRYKKTPKAVKTVKEFLARHMKIRDRDLNKIRIDKYVNEALWFRGIKNPPHKIKVKAIKEGGIVRVELVDFSKKLKFKKARAEKATKAAQEASDRKKAEAAAMAQSAKKEIEGKSLEEKAADKKEEKGKKESVGKASAESAKKEAKKAKHETGGKSKKPKRPVRTTMNK